MYVCLIVNRLLLCLSVRGFPTIEELNYVYFEIAQVEKDGESGNVVGHEEIVEKESETNFTGSEEMELNISHVLEKIECFTQLVTMIPHSHRRFIVVFASQLTMPRQYLMQISELLESGKTMFKELSNEFEERLIT